MSARTVKVFLLMAAWLVAAAAQAVTLDVSPTSVPQGGILTATWSGISPPSSSDWIGLYASGAPNSPVTTYRYTTGTASGNVPFTIPSNLAPGTYQLRLFANSGSTLVATSGNFTVTVPNISLSATPVSVLPGGIVTAAWSGIPAPNASDWVGLYTPSAPNYPEMSRRNTTGTASGSVPFTVPTSVTLGTYQLRLFAAGTYTLLATSGNFTAGLSLGGTVTLNGSPLANVTLAATNGGACGSSNANGQYTCSVPSGWSGTITPQLSGYIFTQSSRSYSNVTVAQTAQNYTATPSFQLNGTVLFNGAPLANVAFAATNGVSCTSSNASGQYSCSAPQGWSGTVTPALNGYLFTPGTHSYSHVTANQSSQDYAATNQAYFVSGTVSVNGVPLANASLTAANGGVCSPSNAWGQYSCAVVPGWSGTVTPSANGYSFAPASRSLTSVGADQGAQDFAATLTSASAPMYFVHVDHLNTPRLVADSSGTTVWKWDQQEPFGNNVADENPSGLGAFDLPLRLPGQYLDKETNLHYNYFRDFDPSVGRYAQSDPIGLKGGLNTYLYVRSSPLNSSDPTGLLPVGPIPSDANEAAVFYNFPDRYRKPTNGCLLDCILKRQVMCIPMRIAGAMAGTSVAAAGSAPSMGVNFPGLAWPAASVGQNVGGAICTTYFFQKSCEEECNGSSCKP